MNSRRPSGAAEGAVARLLGQDDPPQLHGVGVEDVDAVAGRGPDVPLDIDAEPVREARFHDVEDPRPLEPAPIDDVERGDVAVGALDPRDRGVRDVQRPLVGRERQPVGVDQEVGRLRQLARRAIEAEDEAATKLGVGLVALAVVEDPVRRIGEPDRPVGGDDQVVRGVEPVALDSDRPRSSASRQPRSARRAVARARRRGPARRGRACGRWRNPMGGRGR